MSDRQSSSSSEKQSSKAKKRIESKQKDRSNSSNANKYSETNDSKYKNNHKDNQLVSKFFISGLKANEQKAVYHERLMMLFSKKYQIANIQVKKKIGGQYSFAFVQFKEPQVCQKIVSQFSNSDILGSKIKVEKVNPPGIFKDKFERKCFNCSKPGHFAKDCRSNPVKKIESRHDSRDRRQDDKKKSKRSKKHKKYSRSRDQKKRRKHRKYSSSSSSDQSSSYTSSYSSKSSVSVRRESKRKYEQSRSPDQKRREQPRRRTDQRRVR